MVDTKKVLFLGQFEHAMDDKNRLFIPARFREKNDAGHFILTQGLDGCLFLFPSHVWDQWASKLSSLPLQDKTEERAFKRTLLARACEVAVDGQGRVVIPMLLKEYADIKRETVINGVLEHVEIWAKERWDAYQVKARESFERAAQHLAL